MRRQREDLCTGQPAQMKSNVLSDQMQEYVHFLRTQIKQFGAQIDFEFERSSQLIFSLYKHLYSPSQCPGEKATLHNKLSSLGVQWNLQTQFEAKLQQPQAKSQEARSVNNNYNDTKDLQNNKKAYNMRVKTKPQKYRYGLEEEYDYAEKPAGRPDAPRRGRPSSKRDHDAEYRRVEQPNPYEKAPYKKRKPYVSDAFEHNGKEESPMREEPGRSAKWESDEDKDEAPGIESGKNLQSEANDHLGDLGREDARISPSNRGEHHQTQGKLADDAPISELVESYRKYVSAPRIQISLATEQ